MLEFIQISGPFGVLSLVVGLVGLGLALAEAATGGRRTYRRGVGAAAAISLLIGVAGTAEGFYIVSRAVTDAAAVLPESADRLTLWWTGLGVAMTTTVVGCLAAIADLLALCGLAALESRLRSPA
jgi:hypothetical protein